MKNLFSSLPEVAWPAVPPPHSTVLLAMLSQLERTEWMPAQELLLKQFRQLNHVVQHAYRTVPFYRQRFNELKLDPNRVASPDHWQEVPLLARRDIQISGSQLHSTEVPHEHGRVTSTATSGSTNQPVVTLGTEVTGFFWKALTLRDHCWHRRDFSQSLAAIRYTGDKRAQPPKGVQADTWGPATASTIPTGRAFLLNIQSSIAEQAAWIEQTNPGYLLSYPSILLAIAEFFEQQGRNAPTNLRQLRTFGEILEPRCRTTCEHIFGVKVVDMYSSQEVGYIAFQCPQQEHYHLQSESLLVEVLDESGKPCKPGEIGKVIISTLHNFAMPLLRYDIGDFAEVGDPCSCGRGLPVLTRILGRQRNLLVMPDGERRWPIFNAGARPEQLPAFYQFQVIQRDRDELEVHVVREEPLTPSENEAVVRYLQQSLEYPFKISIHCVPSIARSPSGKFEDFISLVQ